uniref:phosphotransferase n=1 Tax=Rhodococcus qingshengii TaxID=334542 RepID=UPI001C4DDB85|nr:phosphotransferase [Rhodococcus qingshengii]
MSDTETGTAQADSELTASLEKHLRQSYALSVTSMKFLGGELDRNYRVSTANGETFLAKIQLHFADRGELQSQEDILVHLSTRPLDVSVPVIKPGVDGLYNRRMTVGAEQAVLRVFDWVEGTELINVAQHSPALLIELGSTAAHITNALDGFPRSALAATHHWDIVRSREMIDAFIADDAALEQAPYVRTVLEWFDAAAPLLPALPKSLVHNDLNDNNVLVDERNGAQFVSGILDFNDALYSIRVAEVAIAGAYAMLRKEQPLEALAAVVAGYNSVTALTDDEFAVVYSLAAARLCVQALTWTSRGRVTPTDYGKMRMRHTLPTLEKLLDIDPCTALKKIRSASGTVLSSTV